ncbi:Rz1-like lysis system protein LysC [Metapseudomonas lalkuanensis]|uniref:Rz1-like lysis system protein LysC n=1 Tax=Metapseudomonas lalkuanensis TaxID=2604832 RepID=UPI0037446089
MKTATCSNGLTSLCLLLLTGCASAPPSPERPLTISGCPAVLPCTLPATTPTRSGDLLTDLDRLEAAWAECAAQVDAVYATQQEPQP